MLREEIISDGRRVRHWSDADMMIRQAETGLLYEDAVDNVPCPFTYEETDEPIPSAESEDSIEDKAEAFDILMGEAE